MMAALAKGKKAEAQGRRRDSTGDTDGITFTQSAQTHNQYNKNEAKEPCAQESANAMGDTPLGERDPHQRHDEGDQQASVGSDDERCELTHIVRSAGAGGRHEHGQANTRKDVEHGPSVRACYSHGCVTILGDGQRRGEVID